MEKDKELLEKIKKFACKFCDDWDCEYCSVKYLAKELLKEIRK